MRQAIGVQDDLDHVGVEKVVRSADRMCDSRHHAVGARSQGRCDVIDDLRINQWLIPLHVHDDGVVIKRQQMVKLINIGIGT